MGWIVDNGTEEASRHEGYAAFLVVAPWGEQVTSGSTAAGGVVVPRLTADAAVRRAFAGQDDEPDEVVPWSEVAGWQAVCECGWRGPTWAIDDVTLSRTENFDSDGALLSDGETVEDAALAAWREHIRPRWEKSERIGAIVAAANRYWQARHELDQVVYAGRDEPALSWADIGQAAGMTRQSAHERWATESGRQARGLGDLPAGTHAAVLAAEG